jgi:hypothetical protein
MTENANLCFESPQSSFFDLEQLAARYPDHRLIYLGDGNHFLKPGTLAIWPWAEDLKIWKRRAFLTPKPVEEWGAREASLARLFDGPALRANSLGLLHLAELFERPDEVGSDLQVGRDRLQNRWSWASRPLRWLGPLSPEEATLQELERELVRYFTDRQGIPDRAALWWLGACAIYPALRWDLTIYLGLKLRTPNDKGSEGVPFYTEEHAIRIAALPWFREGSMPDWLRRRLLSLLPNVVRTQATFLLRDLLERAIEGNARAFDSVRLRIAQDWPDPTASRPERDDIFIDALANQDSLLLQAPRSLQDLKSGLNNAFVAREWTAFAVFSIYWLATALLVPWQSGGPLGFGSLLPLLILPLAFAIWPIAARIIQFGKNTDHSA